MIIGILILFSIPFILGLLVLLGYFIIIPHVINYKKKLERDKAELYGNKINGTELSDDNFYKK